MSFHYRGLKCKSRKSRNTWSNRKIWPWSTEWSRARLIEFCQENAPVIANTLFQQHKRTLYTWTSPDDDNLVIINSKIRLIIFFAAKDGEALYSQQKQDWEMTVAQIMNSLCHAMLSRFSCVQLCETRCTAEAQPSSGQQPQTAAQPSRLLCP